LQAGLGLKKKLSNGKSFFAEGVVDTGANILLKNASANMYVYYPGINLGYTF
jgi:hypothetical protein